MSDIIWFVFLTIPYDWWARWRLLEGCGLGNSFPKQASSLNFCLGNDWWRKCALRATRARVSLCPPRGLRDVFPSGACPCEGSNPYPVLVNFKFQILQLCNYYKINLKYNRYLYLWENPSYIMIFFLEILLWKLKTEVMSFFPSTFFYIYIYCMFYCRILLKTFTIITKAQRLRKLHNLMFKVWGGGKKKLSKIHLNLIGLYSVVKLSFMSVSVFVLIILY